jgi:Tfp pilus assembly protein PilF
MKKIFLLLFTLCFSVFSYAQEEAIKEAETAYTSEDYTKAIELYESILKSYGESAEVYYNLGNAYFKVGEIAPSILNYERALLLDPGDGDIRHNLQVAKSRTVDKIEPIGEFFLSKWLKQIQNLGSVDSWAGWGVVCFILFIGCLILFFFSKWIHLKKIGFYLGLFLFVIVILSNIFASNQKEELLNRKNAIVFTPTVTIKSSPDNSGTDLFLLREGTKVLIKSTLGDWSEIELEDGNIGWIQSKDIEQI